MDLCLLLAEEIIKLFVIVLLGFVLIKLGVLKAKDSKIVSKVVLYLLLPCRLLSSLQIDYSTERMLGIAISFCGAGISMLLLFVLSRLANKFFKFNVVEQASVMYSNASYLVIPIISAILGPEWVIYTCGYVCCQTTFTWTHLVSLMSGENRISLKNIVRNLNLITVAIGMILFITQIRLPAMILDPISSIGSCVGAMSMLTLGMSLGNADFKEIFSNGKAMLVVVCKLIVFPIIITTVLVLIRLGRIFDGAQTVLLITVLTTASPTGVIVTQMAQLFDRDKEYAGIINVMGVIFAIFTMPFMAYYYLLLNGIIG